jgi:hypothetical protein
MSPIDPSRGSQGPADPKGQNAWMTDREPDFRAYYLTSGRFVAFTVIIVCLLGAVDVIRGGDIRVDADLLLGLGAVCLVSYVFGVRPGVLEEVDGVAVRNPLRTFRVPWGSVTDVDVTDVLRVHAAGRVVRCFAIPRRRPAPSQARRTSQNYGFQSMTPSSFGLGSVSGGPLVSRADAVCLRLREQAERYAVTAGPGPVSANFATDALMALAAAAVLLGIAVALA